MVVVVVVVVVVVIVLLCFVLCSSVVGSNSLSHAGSFVHSLISG